MKLAFIALAALLAGVPAVANEKPSGPALVDAVSGVFIYAKDPAALAQWYADKLGVQLEYDAPSGHYDAIFRQTDGSYTLFALWPSKGTKRTKSAFVLSLRLKDYDATLKRLRDAGVQILKEEADDYGRFVSFVDGEGNEIEAWQPKH